MPKHCCGNNYTYHDCALCWHDIKNINNKYFDQLKAAH